MKTKEEIEARVKLFMSNIRKGLSYDANEVMLVDDIYKAITVTHCCKSDSELLCDKNKSTYEFDSNTYIGRKVGKGYM
jgi:hypothetical protein